MGKGEKMETSNFHDVTARIENLLQEMQNKLKKNSSSEEQSKWAKEYLEKLDKLIKHPGLSEIDRQLMEKHFSGVENMLAGMTMKPWLPLGLFRKVIMFLCLIMGFYYVMMGNLWFLLLIFFSAQFSPRFAGELLWHVGWLKRYFKAFKFG
jgi:hypothetical protein